MVGPNIRDRRNMRRTYLVLLPLTNSYRRRCHAESAGNAEAMVRGHIQVLPGGLWKFATAPGGWAMGPPKARDDEGRPAFGRGDPATNT
jgi:hypothetical protein